MMAAGALVVVHYGKDTFTMDSQNVKEVKSVTCTPEESVSEPSEVSAEQ